MQKVKKDLKTKILENWKSGITVALVSLPLNIALSIASGAGPVPGIITGIWAGLLASIFGSSNYNIVGTAGALSSILLAFTLNQTGTQNWVFMLPFMAILSGLIILLIWLFKLDKFLAYIPSSVMHGFAAGVAIVIAFNQLRDALGLKGLEKSPHFLENLKITFEHFNAVNYTVLAIFLSFFILQILFKKYIKAIPAVIPISILGMILGAYHTHLSKLPITTLSQQYANLKASIFQIPNFQGFLDTISNPENIKILLSTAIVIAIVSVLETLITARIGDKLTHDTSDSRKEVFGLGLANIGSGIAGGLPATGVFIRTGLNIKSGANDKISGTIAAIFTAILALILFPLFTYLPTVVIAAMLMNTAIGLIEVHHFKRFFKEDRSAFLVALLVAIVTIIEDASFGILAGVLVSLFLLTEKLTKPSFYEIFNKKHEVIGYLGDKNDLIGRNDADTIVYTLKGALTYLNAFKHREKLSIIATSDVKDIIIRTRGLTHIDLDGADEIGEALDTLMASGKKIYIVTSRNKEIDSILRAQKPVQEILNGGDFMPSTTYTLKQLGYEDKDIIKNKQLIEGLLQ